MEKLISGEVLDEYVDYNLIFPDLNKKESAIWSLFIYSGYLKVISTEVLDFGLQARISIPNKEIRYVYNEIVMNWFPNSLNYRANY